MMPLRPLHLSMIYDIMCPHSWVGYQILQQKLNEWRKIRQINVDYRPASHPFVHKMAYGLGPFCVIFQKKDYLFKELDQICDSYKLRRLELENRFKLSDNRSLTSLLLLMRFKMFLPNYYEKMMAAMWRELWERSGKVNRTTIFLRLARELGIPFKTIDHLLMHTEDRTTTLELHAYNKYLIEEERILGCPWFMLRDDAGQKVLAFGDLLRLELLDEVIPLSDEDLARLMPVEAEEQHYADISDEVPIDVQEIEKKMIPAILRRGKKTMAAKSD